MTEIINVDNVNELPSRITFRGIIAKTDDEAIRTFIQHHRYEPVRAWAYQNTKTKTYYFELDKERERE